MSEAHEKRSAPDHGEDIVPETFLGVSMDLRYVNMCHTLLGQLCEPAEKSTDGFLWCLSAALHYVFAVRRTGITPGMEACGIVPKKDGTNPLLQTSKVLSAALGYAFWIMCLERVGRMTSSDSYDSSSTESSRGVENLRGEERRRIYERLRQQMMNRTSASQMKDAFCDREGSKIDADGFERKLFRIFKKNLSNFFATVCSSNEATPHQPQDNGPLASEFSLPQWIIRLHAAQFCLTGKFPTWFHRFLGLRLERIDGPRMDSNRIHKIVALLVGIQVCASITRKVANHVARFAACRLATTSSMSAPLESRVGFATASGGLPNSSRRKTFTCYICRTNRSDPAAPASCGHVVCWNCLLQWVSAVREECPLCRAPCRSQDVLSLANYPGMAN